MFIQKLKSLSNDDANALMSMLNSKDQKRIQTLFNWIDLCLCIFVN